MPLESTLDDIVTKLREGRYPKEVDVSSGIVRRVLSELNWDVYDTEVVCQEYRAGNGFVDFALCDPPNKPRVFIEVKRPGGARSDDAIEQALLYAFREGVPFVVLTDGQTWSFYLPAEAGRYEDRRVLRLDLYTSSLQDSSDALIHHLEHGRVASGEALEAARREYRDRISRETVRMALPRAWSELVSKGDESLVRLLADAVESQARVRPVDSDVLDFLGSLRGSSRLQAPSLPSKRRESLEPRNRAVIVAGKRHEFKSPVKAMVSILTELQEADRGFLGRLAIHSGIKRATRMVVAKDAVDIYPHSPHLRDKIAELPDGWLVCTNFHAAEVKQVVNIAADVAGTSVEWIPSTESGQSNSQSERHLPSEETGRNKRSTTGPRTISRNGTVIIAGASHDYNGFLQAIDIILRRLQDHDDQLLSKLARHPKITNPRRALIARSVEEIYPDSPHLRHRVRQLRDGWLLCTNSFDSEKAMRFVDALEDVCGAILVWNPPIASD